MATRGPSYPVIVIENVPESNTDDVTVGNEKDGAASDVGNNFDGVAESSSEKKDQNELATDTNLIDSDNRNDLKVQEVNTDPRDAHSVLKTIQVPVYFSLTSSPTLSPSPPVPTSNPTTQRRKQEENGETKRRHVSGDSLEIDLQEEDLILATTLVSDAYKGQNFTFKTDPKYVRSYILFHKWYFRWGLYLFILLNLSLALFEKPTKPGWELPYWGTMIMEIMCLAFFIVRVCHSAYFSLPNIFWRDTKNIMVIGIITLTILDIVCYIIWTNVAPDTHPIRWSRPLRSLLIINFSDGRQIRRAFRNIRRTVPEIANILVLFFMSVLLFGLLALKLFGRRNLKYASGEPYFKTYLDSIWDLYVLVTTANHPDVMLPAYDESNWFAIFFVIYIIICLYIFMSIVLAAIYNNYRTNLKNEIRLSVYEKRRKLREAFEILKRERQGREVITRSIWRRLMKRLDPRKSESQIDLFMKILDADGTGYITKSEFLNLANLLHLPVSEVKDRITLLESKIPNIFNSTPSRILRRIVRHKFFRFFFDFVIFVNAWFIGFDLDVADWVFLSFFMIEIFLKLYTFGPKEFFLRFWNVFDFFVIFGAVVATAVESIEGDKKDELSTLDVLLVLRVLRLIKIFGSIKRFKIVLLTIMNIGPSLLTYGGVIFVLYYIYAIIGMEIFHGLINYYGYGNVSSSEMFCGNPALNESVFYKSSYCNNNFNDILKSFVVLFSLTVVNQWQVTSSGFEIVTSKAARLYFFSFHVTCVVIVMNIFVAFILEAFILEYSLQKTGKLESAVEAKIKELGLGIGQRSRGLESKQPNVDRIELVENEELSERSAPSGGADTMEENGELESDTDSIPDLSAEKGTRFHLKKKSRKKVEVLLQQMFEGEINPDDDKEEEEIQPRRKLTLEAV
ncbi:hypothetical protein CHS0354_004046 [Potamilus streckersoni]|uniref:EF-hand domain-containing protein n=1 Tax=Potamilus streckersoni TaxID=2493646 RepID=A0AAE0T8R2_9BIVA|nr:hypothetical protein CHS0354_004046 [Potamilus streckersoni]